MRFAGTLAQWNDERGFGWIEADGGERVFVHISAFEPRPPAGHRPRVGQRLQFGVGVEQGRKRAEQVAWRGSGAVAAAVPQRPAPAGRHQAAAQTRRLASAGAPGVRCAVCLAGGIAGREPGLGCAAAAVAGLCSAWRLHLHGLLARQIGGAAGPLAYPRKHYAAIGAAGRLAGCSAGPAMAAPQVEQGQLSGHVLADGRAPRCGRAVAVLAGWPATAALSRDCQSSSVWRLSSIGFEACLPEIRGPWRGGSYPYGSCHATHAKACGLTAPCRADAARPRVHRAGLHGRLKTQCPAGWGSAFRAGGSRVPAPTSARCGNVRP